MITLTLKYTDGRPDFIVGGFPDMDSCNAWIMDAQSRPGWDSATQTHIVDNTPPGGGP